MENDETLVDLDEKEHTMVTDAQTMNTAGSQKKVNWFVVFAGLIPLFLMIPFLILQFWVVCIALAIGGSLLLIIWSIAKTRTVSSLDVLTLLFGLANAVLYSGFHNVFLLTHLGSVIYTVLLTQVAFSLVRGKPWTEAYARRSATPEMQQHPLFHEANVFLTCVWGGCFLVSDVLSLIGSGLWSTLVPLALLVLTAVGTPALAKQYARLRAGV